MAKKKLKSGTLGGVEWSESEGKADLYKFARDMDVAGVTSRSSKPEIVAALDKASKKEARAAAKPSGKKTAKKTASKAAASAKPPAPAPKPEPAPVRAARRPTQPPARRRTSPNRPTGGARKVRQGSSIRKKL